MLPPDGSKTWVSPHLGSVMGGQRDHGCRGTANHARRSLVFEPPPTGKEKLDKLPIEFSGVGADNEVTYAL